MLLMLNTQLVYIRPRDMVFTIIAMVHIVPCHHFGKSRIELFIIPSGAIATLGERLKRTGATLTISRLSAS
jgi:hypothetical protein